MNKKMQGKIMLAPNILGKISSTPNISANISLTKIYPELEDLVVTPSEVEQNFKSEMYGYNNVKVKAVEKNPYAEYGESFVKMLNGETNHFEVPDVVEHLSKNYCSFPSNILSIRGNGVKTTDSGFFKETSIERADLPVLQGVSHYAFQDCTYLTEINIPLATSIGIYAFENTQNLIDVKFPKVKSIGDYSFRYSFVQSIEAPETELVYPYAFMEAYNLMSVNLPSAKDLRIGAFSDCYSLMSVTLGALTDTSSDNFANCFSLTDLTVGEGTTASLYLVDTDLTQESLHSIIDNYADMSGEEAPTFNVGEYNLSKIDPDYLVKLERKNINYQ